MIQYAESGYELVNEYYLTVYHTANPIIDDLKLVRARMNETFETLKREYTGVVYKRQTGYGVYAKAEYFDAEYTDWRDGNISMTAIYKRLVPYTYTNDAGETVTILPGEEGYVETFEQGLTRDSQGRRPGEVGYVDTYGDKEYYYELKDVDGNTAGHGEFIGYFPQETLAVSYTHLRAHET